MKFTAEFSTRGYYGNQICKANSIEELINILDMKGFDFIFNPIKEDIVKWSKTTNKKFYGMDIIIRRGKDEMTGYTSLWNKSFKS